MKTIRALEWNARTSSIHWGEFNRAQSWRELKNTSPLLDVPIRLLTRLTRDLIILFFFTKVHNTLFSEAVVFSCRYEMETIFVGLPHFGQMDAAYFVSSFDIFYYTYIALLDFVWSALPSCVSRMPTIAIAFIFSRIC